MNEYVVPRPRLLRRAGGLGFLALSTSEHRWRIGVVGDTPESAEERFYVAHAEWQKLGLLVDQDRAAAKPVSSDRRIYFRDGVGRSGRRAKP